MQNPEKILKLGVGHWEAQVLLCAIEIGLFSELSNGPLTDEEIISGLGLHERSARDFLDSLVSLEMLKRNGNEYSNTEDTDYYLDENKASYIGSILKMEQYNIWGKLIDLLKTGKSPKSFLDRNKFYNELYSDDKKIKEYSSGMTSLNLGANIALAQKFKWQNYGSLVDIGTSQGGLLVQIIERHPHMKGIGIDLPQIKEIFNSYIAQYGLEKKILFQVCDFYKDELPKGDVYTLGHILHALEINERIKLLKKIYNSLSYGGSLIIYEHIIDEERKQNPFALLMSLNMMLESPGSGGLTGSGCINLMKDAGFKDMYVENLTGPSYMIAGFK